jgi:hypothetical protein
MARIPAPGFAVLIFAGDALPSCITKKDDWQI